MHRRSALLLAAPVLAAGLLAGCDLPGGSPKVLGPDRVPNDTLDEAPIVVAPTVFAGTVDPRDTTDWFHVTNGANATRELVVTCNGDVGLAGVKEVTQTEVGIESLPTYNCDGTPQSLRVLDPGEGFFVQVRNQSEDPVTGYTLTFALQTAAPG